MTNEQIEVLRSLLAAYQLTLMQEESEALDAAITLAERVRDAAQVQIGGADGLSAFLTKFGNESLIDMRGKRVALVEVE